VEGVHEVVVPIFDDDGDDDDSCIVVFIIRSSLKLFDIPFECFRRWINDGEDNPDDDDDNDDDNDDEGNKEEIGC
jgi:hypothetical protein